MRLGCPGAHAAGAGANQFNDWFAYVVIICMACTIATQVRLTCVTNLFGIW